MKKKYFILISLLLFSTIAFCQEYNEDYLDSLIQIKAQAEVAKDQVCNYRLYPLSLRNFQRTNLLFRGRHFSYFIVETS